MINDVVLEKGNGRVEPPPEVEVEI
jgi:hypothetical protein